MNDSIQAIIGQWELTGYASDEGREAEARTSRDDDIDAWARELDESAENWLSQAPEEFPDFDAAAGLTLSIEADGRYAETGDAGEQVHIISSDGVLGDSLDVYAGSLLEQNSRILAFTDEEPQGHCRLDDGDTQVTDEFFLDGNELIRVVSMVTDGMYLDRFFYRYEPAEES